MLHCKLARPLKVHIGRGVMQAACSRVGSILGGPKVAEEVGKSPYDLSNGWAAHAYKEASSALNGGEENGPGRHSRRPSFPIVDYEPEHTGCGSSSQVTSLLHTGPRCLACTRQCFLSHLPPPWRTMHGVVSSLCGILRTVCATRVYHNRGDMHWVDPSVHRHSSGACRLTALTCIRRRLRRGTPSPRWRKSWQTWRSRCFTAFSAKLHTPLKTPCALMC